MTEKPKSSFPSSCPDFKSSIYDTEYCGRGKAFSAFRDAVNEGFMPWAMELNSETEFHARVECLSTATEAIGRGITSPVVAVRGSHEIAKSSSDSYYANYVLAGELSIEQCGKSVAARQGDLVVYDSSLPLKMTQRSAGAFDHLAFRIPKAKLIHLRHIESLLKNTLIPADKMMPPLSSCLNFMAHNLLSAATDELRSLYDICALLMPLSVGHFESGVEFAENSEISPKTYMREIMNYIDANINSSELSPRSVANNLGISVRYVHKLFAVTGTTFSVYVISKRLEFVRRDLVSRGYRHQPIFGLAYRWGFNDISTFNRAFKKKYGCSPSEYRAKF